MTKTVALTIAEAETAMESIAKYTELMESQEETKWLSDGAGSIVTSIINQLEQADLKAQSYVKLEAALSSHLTPSELENYSLTDVAITLINNSTGEKSVVEVDDFDLTEFQWIDQDKQWDEEEKEMELNKMVLPLRHEEEVNEVDEFIDRLKSLELDDELLWKIAGTMNAVEAKVFTSNLIDAVEQLEEGEKQNRN